MKKTRHLSGYAVMAGLSHIVILVVLIIAALALVAPLRAGYRLKMDGEEARRKLGELEVLYPLYADLAAMETPEQWPDLQPPAPRKLAEPDVVTVPDQFTQLAMDAGIEIGSVRPHVEKSAAGERYLHVDIQGYGSYEQLKSFLMKVSQMPSLLRIDQLDVRREERQEQINLQAHMALE